MSTRTEAVEVHVGNHIEWHVFGVTLHGDTITSTLVAGAIVVLLGFFVRSRISAREPNRTQLFFETVTEQIEMNVEDTMGIKTAPFVVPLAMTLFLFILVANWLAVLPVQIGGHDFIPPPAADANFTWALALLVFIWYQVAGARRRGAGKHLVQLAKGTSPGWRR